MKTAIAVLGAAAVLTVMKTAPTAATHDANNSTRALSDFSDLTLVPSPSPMPMVHCPPMASVPGTWWNERKDAESLVEKCTERDDDKPWIMLRAYRAGGDEGVHWKYSNDENDPECLRDWIYYDNGGYIEIAKVKETLTKEEDTRSWCPLPVYRKGGKLGKQFAYCVDMPTCSGQFRAR